MSDTQRLSLAPPDSAPPTHMSQWFTELPPRMLSGGWGWSDVCHHCLSSHKLHIHSCLHNCVKKSHYLHIVGTKIPEAAPDTTQ